MAVDGADGDDPPEGVWEGESEGRRAEVEGGMAEEEGGGFVAERGAVVMGEGGGWEDELCCAASRTGFTN